MTGPEDQIAKLSKEVENLENGIFGLSFQRQALAGALQALDGVADNEPATLHMGGDLPSPFSMRPFLYGMSGHMPRAEGERVRHAAELLREVDPLLTNDEGGADVGALRHSLGHALRILEEVDLSLQTQAGERRAIIHRERQSRSAQ